MSEWRWPIKLSSSMSEEYKRDEVQFGDGYEQIVPAGINYVQNEFKITSEVQGDDGASVMAFLRNHADGTPFDFLEPVTGLPMKVRLQRWDVSYGPDRRWWTFNLELRRSYSWP